MRTRRDRRSSLSRAIAFALNLIPSLITAAIAALLVAAVHPAGVFLPGVLRGSFAAAFGAYGFLATAYVA